MEFFFDDEYSFFSGARFMPKLHGINNRTIFDWNKPQLFKNVYFLDISCSHFLVQYGIFEIKRRFSVYLKLYCAIFPKMHKTINMENFDSCGYVTIHWIKSSYAIKHLIFEFKLYSTLNCQMVKTVTFTEKARKTNF